MDRWQALWELGTDEDPIQIETTDDPNYVIVNYCDGSKGALSWDHDTKSWRSVEGYSTDAATATGMYDGW